MELESQCPPDPEQAAEDRILEHMKPEDAIAYDLHVGGCPRCAEVLMATGRYIRSIREASAEYRSVEGKKSDGRAGEN